MLHISVLGPFHVDQNNGSALSFESAKARALLAYLAVEANRLHSRETIAFMLWPDRPDSASLGNLRHTLASLRTSLGERVMEPDGSNKTFFVISPNTIQFAPGKNVWLDLQEFEHHLMAAQLEEDECSQMRIDHLLAAVQLCRGRFMEGFSLKDCPEFEDWMLLRRENNSLKLQKALYDLADALAAVGDWEQALASLRNILQMDPWNEAIHRKVMRLLAVQDHRSAALNQYERCRKLLLDELGVKPEEETEQLFEQIRAGKFKGQGLMEMSDDRRKGSEPRLRAEKRPRNHFVGRSHELSRLHQSLKLALREQGQLLFITGEAGSGKTSLAWEFVHQAMNHQGDLLIAAGRCNAITGREDPFLPFREALQMLVDGNESSPAKLLAHEHKRRIRESFPEILNSLLAAGPDLIDTFISRDTLIQRIETQGLVGNAWQSKLKQISAWPSASYGLVSLPPNVRKPNEAMTRMLKELAHQRPLILFIDDLQWADVESIGMLHYISKRLDGSRIVVIGAYRPQDVICSSQDGALAKERHPLIRVQLELQRVFGEIEVNLDHGEGLEFISALVDRDKNSLNLAFRQMLYSHTKGNPLFTNELLHSMQERGNLIHDLDYGWIEANPFDWDKLPPRVDAVIAEQIGRLPNHLQKLLRAASVEGDIFHAEIAARVLGLDENQVVSWLSGPLSQEQEIVHPLDVVKSDITSSRPNMRLSRYRFRHSLYQKYLYSRIDRVERSVLHEATAAALEALTGKRPTGS